MYHPTRGGVRGGRDQFNWDDVKVDKHRENYLGHSVKAPVGRWQRGKDLHWYTKSNSAEAEQAAIAEIARVQDEEDQAMREALGLAPARESRSQGNHLNKHELQELFKRGKTAEELSEAYVEAERVQGVGFGPVTTKKKVSGYEMGEQLSGIDSGVDPAVKQQAEKLQRRDDGELTKEEKKELRRQEKKAAKLARKEERKRKREERAEKREHRHRSSDDNERQHSPSTTKRHRSGDEEDGERKRHRHRRSEEEQDERSPSATRKQRHHRRSDDEEQRSPLPSTTKRHRRRHDSDSE